jgi:hypothetical protein
MRLRRQSLKSGHRSPERNARPAHGILDAVQRADRERAQLRGALEKIQAVVAGVLA